MLIVAADSSSLLSLGNTHGISFVYSRSSEIPWRLKSWPVGREEESHLYNLWATSFSKLLSPGLQARGNRNGILDSSKIGKGSFWIHNSSGFNRRKR